MRIVMIVRRMRIMSSPTFCLIVFAGYPPHEDDDDAANDDEDGDGDDKGDASSPTFCPIVFARYPPDDGHGDDIDAKGNLNSTDAKLAPQKLAPD